MNGPTHSQTSTYLLHLLATSQAYVALLVMLVMCLEFSGLELNLEHSPFHYPQFLENLTP
jgi:hypothetical protein